jgi:hypothetical protein
MESQELIIHIDWSGPHGLNEIASFNGPTDYGIYQVYGAHHVYGGDVLLYIGLVERQTFATRFSQHGWCPANHDAGRLQVYVGRLFGYTTPDDPTWCRYIRLAERLLIHAHKPAENSQKELGALEPELRNVHVVNWRRYRNLLPEVSGARWSNRFGDLSCDRHFSTDHFPKTPVSVT